MNDTVKQFRATAPDLHFAWQLLPRTMRSDVLCLQAVLAQLTDILTTKENSTGCSESIEQRRAVCLAVIDHLYSGQPTGKPALDQFPSLQARMQLPREWFTRWVEGSVILKTVQRIATWRRLHKMLDDTTGITAMLLTRVLGVTHTNKTHPINEAQVIAAGSGIGLVTTLRNLPAHLQRGQLLLPLDDLVKFKLTEHDIKTFAQANSTQNDPRWSAMMQHQSKRAANLLRGGLGAVQHTTSHPAAKAAAVLLETYTQQLTTFTQRGCDPFAPAPDITWWSRMRNVPIAIKRAHQLIK